MCQRTSESPLSIDKQDSDSSIMTYLHVHLHEARKQANTVFPTMIGLLLGKIPWIISLHFVGSIGAEELAPAALATTLCNVTGMSFSVGLNFAITTLAGQARGDLLRKGKMAKKHGDERKHQVNQNENEIDNDEENHQDQEEHLGEVTCSTEYDEVNDNVDAKSKSIPLRPDESDVTCSTDDEEVNENMDVESESIPLVQPSNANTSISYGSAAAADSTSISSSETTQSLQIDENTPLQPLVFLYRALAIQLAFVVPIGIWWINGIKPVLLGLGQAEKISTMTEVYLRILAPGLWAYSINWTITSFLQSIEMSDIPAWAAFVGFSMHIPFNILFVNILGFGYEGVAMATVMFQLVQPFINCIYLFGTVYGKERLLEGCGAKAIGRNHLSFWPEMKVAVGSLNGIKQYLSLALPGIVMISEWWASECAIFLSGNLTPDPDYSLGAMSIYQTILSFFFMFPMGISIACSSRVGMHLGMNEPKEAQLSSTVGVILAGFVSGIGGLILFCAPHTLFPSLFSPDEKLVNLASELMPMLALYVFADGVQAALSGIVKGCGRQSLVMPIVVIAYWVVGLPLAYYNAFHKYGGTTECGEGFSTCGVQGMVFGMTTGTWTHFLLLAFVFSITINWKEEAAKAQARVSQ